MNFSAIILCGGTGSRANLGYNKVFYEVGGKPLLWHAINSFINIDECEEIIVVSQRVERRSIEEMFPHINKITYVDGGSTRQKSVENGVAAVKTKNVLVHDAARGSVSEQDAIKLVLKLRDYSCALPCLPIADTLKHVENNQVKATVDRSKTFRAQTPQAFYADLLKVEINSANKRGQNYTDEITLFENKDKYSIGIIEGSEAYNKFTFPSDFQKREENLMFRIGQSTDIHEFEKGRDLILGGVKIDYDYGLKGHSDADVLLHAVAESILGALGLGDLGTHFPDTDQRYKGADSKELLKKVIKLMNEMNYKIGNIDTLILVESPKMAPHIEKMRTNISFLCQTNQQNVNVKATRGEKMGFIGRGEGCMAQAVVLLQKTQINKEL